MARSLNYSTLENIGPLEKKNYLVSIICPVYNEEKYIKGCVSSVLAQDYSRNIMEILFVDGNSTDNTITILKEYQKEHKSIKIISNPRKTTPAAMNLGIKNSQGDIIIRLDAHALYPSNYISGLVKKLIELDADNVGVALKSDVLHKNSKALAIKEVLSNKFGVGNATFRLGVDRIKEIDTVPFGCWKKEVFDKYGYFDERLERGQDIELNRRIKKNGGKIYIIPGISCTYFTRETFLGLAKQQYKTGKWDVFILFFTRYFHSLSIRHFVPMVFVLSLILPCIAMFIWRPCIFISVISFSLYLIVVVLISAYLSIKKHLNFIYLILSFLTLHIFHGFGSLIGIFDIVIKVSRYKQTSYTQT
jgi:glycosyltransferase involved in cell wall biosynthesis